MGGVNGREVIREVKTEMMADIVPPTEGITQHGQIRPPWRDVE